MKILTADGWIKRWTVVVTVRSVGIAYKQGAFVVTVRSVGIAYKQGTEK